MHWYLKSPLYNQGFFYLFWRSLKGKNSRAMCHIFPLTLQLNLMSQFNSEQQAAQNASRMPGNNASGCITFSLTEQPLLSYFVAKIKNRYQEWLSGGRQQQRRPQLSEKPLISRFFVRYALKKKNDIIWEFFPNVGPPPTPPFWEPLIIMALLGPKMAEHGKLADVPKRSKRAQNDPRWSI